MQPLYKTIFFILVFWNKYFAAIHRIADGKPKRSFCARKPFSFAILKICSVLNTPAAIWLKAQRKILA